MRSVAVESSLFSEEREYNGIIHDDNSEGGDSDDERNRIPYQDDDQSDNQSDNDGIIRSNFMQ